MKKKGIDWDNVEGVADVDVANRTLAERLGVSEATVSIARRRRGIIVKDKRKHFDWPNVPGIFDTSVSHASIARSLGCTRQAVASARQQLCVLAGHGAPPVFRAVAEIRAVYLFDAHRGAL